MSDKTAVVTGASNGLGRGIARALGSRGFTVYLTGRSADALNAAAQEVSEAGGKGIAVQCDHADDDQVCEFFAKVEREAGRLDLLVNNAAAVHPQELSRPGPFWEKDINLAQMIDVGLRSSYIASFYAAPLMIRTGKSTGKSLIAMISFYGAVSYFHGPAYGAAKAGTDKMVHDMGVDFADTDVSVVSYWPGYILTDAVKAVPAEHFPEPIKSMLPEFETPEFSGLVLAAMLDDPGLKALSAKALIGARMGAKLGIKDTDGKQPRDWAETMGAPIEFFVPQQEKMP